MTFPRKQKLNYGLSPCKFPRLWSSQPLLFIEACCVMFSVGAWRDRGGTAILQIEGGRAINLHLSNSVSGYDFSSPSAKFVFRDGELCVEKCITQTHYGLLLASSNAGRSTLVLHSMMHYQLSSGWIVALAGFISVFKVRRDRKKQQHLNPVHSFAYKISVTKLTIFPCYVLWKMCQS